MTKCYEVPVTQHAVDEPVVVDPTPTQMIRQLVIVLMSMILLVVLAFWGFHAVEASDPYIHDVLSLTGDPVRGESIFRLNCATCHGLEASGEVGPDLRSVSDRKSKVGLIKQVTMGKTPPMPQFQPNARDMADLLSFLETL